MTPPAARPIGFAQALTVGTAAPATGEPEAVPEGGDPRYMALLQRLWSLHVEKSAGYGTGADPLRNFNALAEVTTEPAYTYPRRRMVEKLIRCESLEAQGRAREMVEEYLDLAGLALCGLILLEAALPDAGEGQE